MGEDIITYSKLREYQRDERREPTLIKLPKNIIKLIKAYLKEKQKVLEKNQDDTNLFSQDMSSRVEYELKNVVRCITNMFEIRQKKIIDKAFQTSKNDVKVKDTTNMLGFEKKLFKTLIKKFNNYRSDCIKAILKHEEPEFEKEKTFKRKRTHSIKESDKVLVRIIQEVPSFQWEDGSMGPFKEEDVVNVPKKLGELLIKQDRAKEVKKR